jgi:hypothetical protein
MTQSIEMLQKTNATMTVYLEQRETREIKVTEEKKAAMATKVKWDLLDPQDHLDLRVFQVCQVL